jgi:kinetochore protein Mis13/DSN1
VQQRLRALAQTLEPSVDIFADGVHKLAQYRIAAERVADKVLAHGARVLEERDKSVKEASGTVGLGGLDALRALGGALTRR